MSLNLNNFAQDEEELRVKSFTLLETGEYNPVHLRPYDFNLGRDDELFLQEQLSNSVDTHPTVTPGIFKGRLNKILAPAATAGSEVQINGGWDLPRFRWIATLEWFSRLRGSRITQVVSGYTDPTNIRRIGHDEGRVDPSCRFYITSCVDIRESRLDGGNRGGRDFFRLNRSDYVFSDPEFRSMGRDSRRPTKRLMRMSDVLSSSTLPSEMVDAYQREGAYDTTGVIRDRATLSSRRDSNAAHFLTGLINHNSRAFSEYGQAAGDDRGEIMNTAIHNSTTSTTSDRFLSYLRSTLQSKDVSGVFEFDELESAFQDLDRVMNIMFYDSSNQTDFADLLRSTHMDRIDWKLMRHTRSSNTEHLRGSGLVDQAASILANTIPTIAFECGLGQVIFAVTNRVDSNRLGGRRYHFSYVWMSSLSKIPPEYFREQFEARVATEILDNISFDNIMDFEFEIALDVQGDIKMDLFVDDGHSRNSVPFCYPAWGASLYSPQVTEDNKAFYRMTEGVRGLQEMVSNFNEARMGYSARDLRNRRDPMYDDNDSRMESRDSVFDTAEREDRDDDDRRASRDRERDSDQEESSIFARRD